MRSLVRSARCAALGSCNLAIEDNAVTPAAIPHWLIAARGQIDNRKPRMHKPDAFLGVVPMCLMVGAALRQRAAH